MIKTFHGPRKIEDIWKYLNNSIGHVIYFRLRNTKTLEDYFVIGCANYSHGIPKTMQCVKCDESIYNKYEFDCGHVSWALLSSKEEILSFVKLSWREASTKVKCSYRNCNSQQQNQTPPQPLNPFVYKKLVEIERFGHSF